MLAPHISVVNLGCRVNRVESDRITADLMRLGFAMVEPHDADLIVINTCAVTGEAEAKTRKAVRHALAHQNEPYVVVTGCVVNLHPEELLELSDRVIAEPSKIDVAERVCEVLGVESDSVPACSDGEVVDALGRSRLGVKIQDGALIAAATLSDRYITDRFLPDKAIDLVDEACANIKTEMNSMPSEMEDVKRKIMTLEIEETSLKKETDKLSVARLETLRKEIADLKEKYAAMNAKLQTEKDAINKVQKLREEIESVSREAEAAEREYDLDKAAKLRYGRLPELKKQLADSEAKAASDENTDLLHDKVTEEDIAKIVCRWTGIPVSKLMEGEREKLLSLEDILHKRVIGQDEAVRKVAEAILRARAGIADPSRPLGSFLFLGPTGVGKTELAKTLAKTLFDDEKNLIRLDMSEYMEKFSVSRLIGAPPGYVGFEDGGQLTEAVRRKPYSVVLFDEIEKAHPDVFNVLLQVLDDGRITDSQGRTVDFKNTVIILTSNLGSSAILEGIDENGEIKDSAKEEVMRLLKSSFRPEFLNRLDEIVFYKPLQKTEIGKIVDLMLESLKKRLEEQQIGLHVTTAAKDYIIDNGYDPVYGARPLKCPRWAREGCR